MQLLPDDFAFEASEDISDSPGRYVQPGLFTIVVGDQVLKVQVAGDPLLENEWLRVPGGLREVRWPPAADAEPLAQLY